MATNKECLRSYEDWEKSFDIALTRPTYTLEQEKDRQNDIYYLKTYYPNYFTRYQKEREEGSIKYWKMKINKERCKVYKRKETINEILKTKQDIDKNVLKNIDLIMAIYYDYLSGLLVFEDLLDKIEKDTHK